MTLGDNISFMIFINELPLEICNKHYGVHVGNRQYSVLLYADNTVFAAETVQEMQALLTIIEICANKWRLRANLPKSQVVYFLLFWGEYLDNLKSND